MDLLSLTSWIKYNVRKGAFGEELTHYLPLIIMKFVFFLIIKFKNVLQNIKYFT